MAKPQPNAPGPAPQAPAKVVPVTGKFYSVMKVEHLLYEALEITVRDGRVIACQVLSRAPDMAANAVGIVSRDIWSALRVQTKAEVLGESA